MPPSSTLKTYSSHSPGTMNVEFFINEAVNVISEDDAVALLDAFTILLDDRRIATQASFFHIVRLPLE